MRKRWLIGLVVLALGALTYVGLGTRSNDRSSVPAIADSSEEGVRPAKGPMRHVTPTGSGPTIGSSPDSDDAARPAALDAERDAALARMTEHDRLGLDVVEISDRQGRSVAFSSGRLSLITAAEASTFRVRVSTLSDNRSPRADHLTTAPTVVVEPDAEDVRIEARAISSTPIDVKVYPHGRWATNRQAEWEFALVSTTPVDSVSATVHVTGDAGTLTARAHLRGPIARPVLRRLRTDEPMSRIAAEVRFLPSLRDLRIRAECVDGTLVDIEQHYVRVGAQRVEEVTEGTPLEGVVVAAEVPNHVFPAPVQRVRVHLVDDDGVDYQVESDPIPLPEDTR